MIEVFPAKTRLQAWMAATEHLINVGHELNCILTIESPQTDGACSKAARARIDQFLLKEEQPSLHTVAETIFPAWEYRKRGLAGVFETYPAEYETLRKADARRWGTYAFRLVRRRTATSEWVNPLERLINKMKAEAQRANQMRSCFELGIAEGEYDLPLYDTVRDAARRRGGPCLSHLSFKLYDHRVHLTAVYRSHDYRYKALGNLLGLARLQACVSEQVGLQMGGLVVHSTYAFVDKAKAPIKQLVADIRNLEPKDVQ